MIQSRKDLKDYLAADSKIYRRNLGIRGALLHLIDSPVSDQKYIWKYIKAMRYAEYWINRFHSHKTPFAMYYLHKMRKYGRKTGFQIHPNSCGKGLKIWHYGPIIIGGKSILGENITMRPPILLGHKLEDQPAPTVGDNVEINSGVKLIGDIHIGDDVIIGPNSVVTKSIPSHSIVVGIPARIIKSRLSYDDSWK
ncbi:serine O-acetyltransferase [Bacteroides sp.]